MSKSVPQPPVHPTAHLSGNILSKWLKEDGATVGKILHLHLATEEVITICLRDSLRNPNILFGKSSRSNYAVNLKLLEAIHGDRVQQGVYEFLRQLNRFRNRLSHSKASGKIFEGLSKLAALDIPKSSTGKMPGRDIIFKTGDEKSALELLTYQVHASLVGLTDGIYQEAVLEYHTALDDFIDEIRQL